MKTTTFLVLSLALSIPTVALADAPSEADLAACFGGKKSWTPTALAKLKPKMSPAAAAAVLPGADQVSQYGFVTVKPDGCAGAAEFELYFAKNKKTDAFELSRATILFDSKTSADEAFYASLVKITSAKYGRIKKQEEVTKKLITWVNRSFKIAQLSNKPTRDGRMLQLSVSL